MPKIYRGLIAFLLASCASAGFYDDKLKDPEDGQLDLSRYLSEDPLGFLPVPAIITEPAVGYGLAVGALFFHESAAQRKQRTEQGAMLPENITILGGGGTENGSWGTGIGQLGFWHQDTLRYTGFLLYGSINLDYYSLPSVGELPKPIELNLEGPFVLQKLLYRIPSSKLFVGARQMYRRVKTGLTNNPDFSLLPAPVGDYLLKQFEQDTTTSGIGPEVDYDTRDNTFNPQQGYFYSANYMIFDGKLGSDVDYQSYNVTALNYWHLGPQFNLGLRLQYDGVSADTDEKLPPYVPPFVDLRGVPSSRYQGNRVAVAEVQLDYKLNARWKIGVFTGVGRAAEQTSELGSADNINNYGTGFRYLIARRYGYVMGLDLAHGEGDTAVYIQAGSTW